VWRRVGCGSVFAGPPPAYARYLVDAAATPAVELYDYIVVGGGTAGCPLAATLAGPGGGRVLLLERGGAPSEFPALATAGGFVRTLAMADPAPESDAPAQGFTSEDGVPNVRARVLGGGTAINAGFYSRAHPEWFRGHAEVGFWHKHFVFYAFYCLNLVAHAFRIHFF
jgi:mandelonitrile lyase